MSNSFPPHGLQHARLPCPSPTPRAYSNSCPLSWRCHPTISSSVIPFSSCLQSFPALGSFLVSQFFHSWKASISSPLSFLYSPTLTSIHDYGKTIALTRGTFVGKVMSLLFNMLSRLVIAFLPKSKRLLISWLQSPSEWFWSPQNKVCYCFHCFPIYLPRIDGTGCHDLCFLNVEF